MQRARQRLISDRIPLRHHLTDEVILKNDGGLFTMLEITGLPWETLETEEVIRRHIDLSMIVRNIAHDSVILHEYRCRTWADPDAYPKSKMSIPIAQEMDDELREKVSATLFANKIYIGIEVKPTSSAGEFIEEQTKRFTKPADETTEELFERIEATRSILLQSLAPYGPRQLGIRICDEVGNPVDADHPHAICFSEIAEALVFAMTGRQRAIGLTTGVLGQSMFSEYINGHKEPRTIVYEGPGSTWYGTCLGFQHYMKSTWPGILDKLLAAPYCHTTYQSFRFIQTSTAQDVMRKKGVSMKSAKDAAKSLVSELDDAADALASADSIVMGDHCFTLLVFANTKKQLREVATAAWSDLSTTGAKIAREPCQETTLFSLCPGNSRNRPRPGYVSSLNFTSFSPIHAYPTGSKTSYWGDPIAIFRTVSGEAYRCHLHPRDEAMDFTSDVGNVFVTGMTGAGKSTVLSWFAMQAIGRLGAQCILWDKDRGLKILVRALGGVYLELGTPTGLAPLRALRNVPEDIEFLVQLITGCIMSDGLGKPITHEETRRIYRGLDIVMRLPSEQRWLKDVRAMMGVDPEGAGARLEKWCWGREMGGVIDCPKDVVDLGAPIIGFDQTKFLDNPLTRGPIMATLFHYTDKLIDGRRLLFGIDEFWKSLTDPAFRGLVSNQLKARSRKGNSPTILATQSPADAYNSELGHTIRAQCPTQMHFASGKANRSDYCDLTDTEFEIVAALTPGTGEFLIKQLRKSVRAQLPLRGLTRTISILSGRDATVKLFDRIEEEAASKPIADVLRQFDTRLLEAAA